MTAMHQIKISKHNGSACYEIALILISILSMITAPVYARGDDFIMDTSGVGKTNGTVNSWN